MRRETGNQSPQSFVINITNETLSAANMLTDKGRDLSSSLALSINDYFYFKLQT